ncbi:hypothetical protein EDD22DRAFT_865668 [Suillus occidentalis]|nr:hypothetical protein EDD22DRAFT_865668 [Suillus occidentalis]
MPVIRRGSTYLDVSTTPHTPKGRLRLDKLCTGRNLAQKHAVCTALLFICDENRNLSPADTLSVSFEEFKTTLKRRASAADLKVGSCQHTHLRRVLSFFWEHGYIDLTLAHNGRQRDVVQQIEIQSSFYDIYRGFQEVLDGYGTISAREKYRAYMSLATKEFGTDRTPTVLQVARCAFQYSRKYQDLAASIQRERDAANIQENILADNEVYEGDDSMDLTLVINIIVMLMRIVFIVYRQSEAPHEIDNQVVLFTPARSHSNRDIGLLTPESLPRRQMVVPLPLSTASSSGSEVTSSGNDAHSHSDRQNPQTPGSRYSPISLALGYFAGFVGGFRSSSHMFLPEISSLQTQVTDLQTSLTAAEDALHAANKTTQVSQKRCLGILEDLENALKDIADLKRRAEIDAVEKDSLQQEVGHLKDEVSRLQSGVEQITRIARGLMPL